MKLGLGTVQFGMDYGVSNLQGKTSPTEVDHILRLAADNGVQVLDTAAVYGDSEVVLGQLLAPDHDFRIVTKTPSFKTPTIHAADAVYLRETFHRSLENLRQGNVYGLLVHHADDLLVPGGERIFAEMQRLLEDGLVRKIGVSVYSGQQIDNILELYTPDIVQLPLNLFDQRLLESGHLEKLKRRGVEIHARSVFLQGLLLVEPDRVPPHFRPISDELERYARFLEENKLTRLQATLAFAAKQRDVDVVLVGVTSVVELRDILSALDAVSGIDLDMSALKVADERMVNPSLWKL